MMSSKPCQKSLWICADAPFNFDTKKPNIKLKNIVSQLSLFEKHKIIFWTVENEDISKEKDAGLYAIMKDNPQIN